MSGGVVGGGWNRKVLDVSEGVLMVYSALEILVGSTFSQRKLFPLDEINHLTISMERMFREMPSDPLVTEGFVLGGSHA